MYCKNCGNPIDEGVKFCIQCGARVEAEPVPEEKVLEEAPSAEGTSAAEVSPEEPAIEQLPLETLVSHAGDLETPCYEGAPMPSKPKKNWRKILITVAASIVSVVGITAAASAIFPEVSNALAKTFLPGEKYLAYALKKTAAPIAEDVTTFRSALGSDIAIPTGGTVSAEYVFGDGFYELVGKNSPEATAALSWVKSVGVEGNVKSGGNVYGADLTYTVNGKNLVSGEMVLDMNNGDVYLSAPDFLAKPLRASTGITMSGAEIEEVKKLYEGLVKIVPEEKVLKNMLSRYMAAAGKAVSKADKKNEKISAGGVTESTTCVKVSLSEKLALNVTKAILKEAKGDKDIKNILKNVESFAGQVGESFDADAIYDEMQDGIDALLDNLDDVKASSTRVATLKFWVNNRGEIIGIGLSAEGAEVKFYVTQKGSKTGVLYSLDMNGQTMLLEGSSENAGGKINGSYTVSVKGAELVKITVSDVDEGKLKDKGVFSGKMVIEPSEAVKTLGGMSDVGALLNGARIEITSNAISENEGSAEIAVYLGGKHFVSLKANAKLRYDSAAVSIPTDYVSADDGEGIEPILYKEAIVEKLRGVGAPDFVVSEVEQSLAPEGEMTLTEMPTTMTGRPGMSMSYPKDVGGMHFQYR